MAHLNQALGSTRREEKTGGTSLNYGRRESRTIKKQSQPRSSKSSMMSDSKEILKLSVDDPEHPWNWSQRKKLFVSFAGVTTVLNSTLGSSLPSGGITFIAKEFGINGDTQLVLPISIFLLGYVVGPLLFGPLSETFGRRIIMLATFSAFTVFTMACALAPSWGSFLFFRLVCGIAGSSPISVVGGIYADIYNDPVTRGRANAGFMATTILGPVCGPLISGFISPIGWRWTYWVALMLAGLSWIPLILLPETYAPTILQKRAKALRKKTGNERIYAPEDLEKRDIKHIVTVVLTRPVRMFLFEPIVLFSCLFLCLTYSIFYLFFEAYPIVFRGIYGMNAGVSGLAFLPIGVGSLISCALFVYYDIFLQHAKAAHKPWTSIEEYRRLPLACIGGPLITISIFWFGWTSRADIHWIVPMLSGVPFGIGNLFLFMALLNYLADAYKIFSASAMAASSCTRSLFGACLPFATKTMYARLGVNWASTLLGCVSLVMSVIPFVFIKYGDRIRVKSEFCQYLLEQERKTAGNVQPEEVPNVLSSAAEAVGKV